MISGFAGVALVGLVIGRMEHERDYADGAGRPTISRTELADAAVLRELLASCCRPVVGVDDVVTVVVPVEAVQAAEAVHQPRESVVDDSPIVYLPFAPATDLERIVCAYFQECSRAVRVMYCESGGRTWADNGNGHRGLFQIAEGWATDNPDYWTHVFEPEWNIQMAVYILGQQGWEAWSCR